MLCPRPLPKGKVVNVTPLAVIEILSPDDKMRETLARFRDYARIGVPHIVQMDPEEYVAYRFERGSLIETRLAGLLLPGQNRSIPFDSQTLLDRLEAGYRLLAEAIVIGLMVAVSTFLVFDLVRRLTESTAAATARPGSIWKLITPIRPPSGSRNAVAHDTPPDAFEQVNGSGRFYVFENDTDFRGSPPPACTLGRPCPPDSMCCEPGQPLGSGCCLRCVPQGAACP